ncbi:MFS transporter [Streptomyces sp. NPDC001920]
MTSTKLGPLTHPGMRRLLLSTLVSAAGDAFLLVALPFAVLEFSDAPSALGIVLAAHTIALVVFMLPGGLVGDRRSPTATLLLTDVVRVGTQATAAALVLTGTASVWALAAVYAVHGAASAFHFPTSRAVITQLVPKDAVQSATALLSITYSTAMILGPLAGGLAVAWWSPGTAIALDAFSFLLSAVLIGGLGVRRPRSASGSGPMWKEAFGGFAQVRARRWLALGLCHAALFQCFAVAPNQVLGPLISHADYGGSGDWALLLSVASCGHLVGGLMAVKVIPSRPLAAVFVSAALAGPVLVALGAAVSFAVPLVLMGLYGVAISYADTVWHSVIQRWLPGEFLGRVFAIDGLISLGLRPVAITAVAAVGSWWGVHEAALVGGLATVVLSVVLLAFPTSRGRGETHESDRQVPAEVQESA